jgi:hypothetical protein
MRKVIVGTLMLLGSLAPLVPGGAQAQPDTCQGWLQLCRAQCPNAMLAIPSPPPGCNCQPRFQACKVTKRWESWKPGIFFPVKG